MSTHSNVPVRSSQVGPSPRMARAGSATSAARGMVVSFGRPAVGKAPAGRARPVRASPCRTPRAATMVDETISDYRAKSKEAE
ncbi:hypothetical protein GCM10010106_23770 [Thermopolyspora flexuosa]|nr:hypothetical protein GCM10010106_23770 [Thermopolyspora flexuosa]